MLLRSAHRVRLFASSNGVEESHRGVCVLLFLSGNSGVGESQVDEGLLTGDRLLLGGGLAAEAFVESIT